MTLPFNGQAASLVIGEAQASGSTRRAENPVLLEQVLNDRERLSIDPTGEQKEKEGERPRRHIRIAPGQPSRIDVVDNGTLVD